ncbi:MAG: hypothetical protein WD335_01000 [Candidatus Paceibacterota bacterium]
MTKYTDNPKQLITLISGIFMVAVLAVMVGVSGLVGTSDFATETSAETLVEQNEEASFEMFGETTLPPIYVNIWSDGDDEFTTAQSFTLSWDSGSVVDVQADSSLDYWGVSGSLPTSGTSLPISESSPGTYTYGLLGFDGDGNQVASDEVKVTIIEPPRFDLSFPDGDEVDLDGEPGSITGIDFKITSEEGYKGDVRITIDPDDVDPDMRVDGGYLIRFWGFPNTVTLTEGASSTITISMETLQAILTDETYEVEVLVEDQSGTTVPPDDKKTGIFKINADGFAPRTIEEF